MKKLVALIIGVLLLTACQSKDASEPVNKEGSSQEKPVEQNKGKEVTSQIKFENGNLETDKFSLTISKTEVIQSPMEDKPGLFVTFNLKNKTENEDIVPREVLDYFKAQQENETSRIDLVRNYYFLDAFGDDTETYNKMVDLSNANSNALLPGKSIDIVDAYALDNDTHDVTFIGVDQNTNEEIGKHTINIK